MRRLIVNTASLSIGNGLSQGLTALAYLLAARALGPSQFGQLAAFIGVAALIVVAGDFGLNAWSIRELAQSESDRAFDASLSVRGVVAIGAGCGWICIAGGLALIGVVPWYVTMLGVWIGSALLWAMLLTPHVAGERMHNVAFVTAAERLVLVAVVVVGVLLGAGPATVAVGLAAGGICAAVLAGIMLDPSMRRIHRPTPHEFVTALRSSLGFATSSLALQAQRLDVAIVSLTAGAGAAGIYAAPARLTGLLGILPGSLSTSLFPRASRQEGPIWTRAFVQALTILTTIMSTLIIPLFVFSEQLVVYLLGDEYISSSSVLRIILIGMILASLNQPIAVTYQARGFENLVARTITIGSLFGLMTIGIGSYLRGATGGAVGFVVLQVVIFSTLISARPRVPEQHARNRMSVLPDKPDSDAHLPLR